MAQSVLIDALGSSLGGGGGGGSGIVTTDLELELDASNSDSWDDANAVWEDLTANGNDYTFGAQPEFTSGSAGYLNLDSVNSDDEATGGDTGFVYGANPWTLMLTFYYDTITGFANTLFTLGTNASEQGFYVAVDSGNALYVEFGGGTQLYASTGLSASTWYNVMLHYDGTTFTIFLNDTSEATRTVTLALVAGSQIIGDNDPFFGGDNTDGRLHHVAYWSQALSSADRTTSHDAIMGRFP